MYRRDAKNAGICERLVDLDEGIAEWRYRHVRMVERTIGIKPGTGGSRSRLSAIDDRSEPVSRSVGDPLPAVDPSLKSRAERPTLAEMLGRFVVR